MIIYDFNIVSARVPPGKAKTPLIVDADTVLPFPIAAKRLQSISRLLPNRREVDRCCQHGQSALRRTNQIASANFPRKLAIICCGI